jgi:DNA invertase Pin-like site-specific DNA recombinase
MTPKTDNLKLVLAIRTSQRKQDGESPHQQRQAAEAAAAAGGNEITAELDSGRSESGKTMERDTLRRVREGVEAGEWDGVILGYLDRLGRAPIEESMSYVRALLGEAGGVMIAADWGHEPIDLRRQGVEDMLVMQLQMHHSQWERNKERHRTSQLNAVRAGKHVGPTLLGYLRVRGKTKEENGRLVEDPVYGPVIREAYRIAAHDGLAACVAYLSGAVPERNWNTDSVRKLLKSETYLGRTKAQGSVNHRAHVALTTPELHAAAQVAPTPRRANGDYPMSGVAHCEVCGATLTGQLQTVRGRVYGRRYRCSGKACNGGSSINAGSLAREEPADSGLETRVRAYLARMLGDAKLRVQVVPGDLDTARDEWERAKGEVEAFIEHTSARADGYERVLGKREAERDEAEATFRKVAGENATCNDLPAAEELHEPKKFEHALRAATAAGLRIVVRRGRGAVAERVLISWVDDGDEGAGVLAA